jgi:hypothetical protein
MRQQMDVTFDAAFLTKDAGAVVANGADQVAAANKIIDLGGVPNRIDARLMIDVSAMDLTSGDETYQIHIQGSSDPTFTTPIWTLATQLLGKASGRATNTADSVLGRYELAFCNELLTALGVFTTFRYLRTYHVCAGTTPSINYTAFIGMEA